MYLIGGYLYGVSALGIQRGFQYREGRDEIFGDASALGTWGVGGPRFSFLLLKSVLV